MKVEKIFTLFVFLWFVPGANAQAVRLSGKKEVKTVDIFMAPGINKNGEKILQVSFRRLKKLNKEINTGKILLNTSDGNKIALSDPIKDTSYYHNARSRSWYATYTLTPGQIALMKSEKLMNLEYFIEGKRKSFEISSAAAEEYRRLMVAHF